MDMALRPRAFTTLILNNPYIAELLLALFHRSLEKPNNFAKGQEGTFWGNGNVKYLDLVVFTQAYTLERIYVVEQGCLNPNPLQSTYPPSHAQLRAHIL